MSTNFGFIPRRTAKRFRVQAIAVGVGVFAFCIAIAIGAVVLFNYK